MNNPGDQDTVPGDAGGGNLSDAEFADLDEAIRVEEAKPSQTPTRRSISSVTPVERRRPERYRIRRN